MNDLNNDAIREFGFRELRIPTNFPLQLKTDEAVSRLIEGQCLDISADGMAVRCAGSFNVGTRLLVLVAFPGASNVIQLPATVVRAQADQYGLTFVFSTSRERETVRAVVDSLAAKMVRIHRTMGSVG